MDRPRRDSRQHNGIIIRGLSQPTFATKSALYGHGDVYDWSLQADHKRTLTGRRSKASI